ncbi:APC family permease [Bacillus sp. FJAT-27231]|uniref:APC family permease n=1 Tax=Bacillus sp. FJAT-27231 TaxID=1679168 RepID=UPI000B17680D|nr:APC family permease [Bacillus sp. FJAT-27231]
MSTANQQGQQSLQRVLKTRDLVIFGLIFISPNSAQSLFGELTFTSGGHGVLAIFVGLIAMIFTAASYGKMASIVPKAGSTYSYVTHSLNPGLGFIAGWAILLDYLIFPMMIYKLSSTFAMELFPFVPLWLMLLILIIPMTFFNYRGAKLSAHLNTIMLIVKLISVFLFIGCAAYALIMDGGIANLVQVNGLYKAETFSVNALIAGASIAVLAYIGFDGITALAEDAQVSGKTVGRAAIITCVISSLLIGIQVYFASVIQSQVGKIKHIDTAFYDIAAVVGGSSLAVITTVILVVTGTATALAGQASGSRVLFSMGRDGVLPAFFAQLHPKYKTPVYSVFLLAVLGYVGALMIPISVFFLIVVFGAIVGFIFVNISVIAECFIKRKERRGKDFFTHFISPLLGISVCVYILLGMELVGQVVGICWLLIGGLVLMIKTQGFRKEVSALNIDQ